MQSFRYSYSREDLSKSFRNLSFYYLNEFKNGNNDEDIKLAIYLNRLAENYNEDLKESDDYLNNIVNENILNEYNNHSIEEIKDYLKSKGLPYGPSIEVITICKNLGFQLDEDKKVVPALFYFNIAYDLTHDPAIKDVIDDLNEKVERRLNE